MWDINDPRAHKIHTRIGEMIALDYHPFSIVDNVGFIYLLCSLEPKYVIPSRRYITETVMPTIYDIYILTNWNQTYLSFILITIYFFIFNIKSL